MTNMTQREQQLSDLLNDIIAMGDKTPVSGTTIRMMMQRRSIEAPNWCDANSYRECVACCGTLVDVERDHLDRYVVRSCNSCRGIHIVATNFEYVQRWVNTSALVEQKAGDVTRYFDATYRGASDGTTRRTHGWYVPARDRAVVQFG